MTTVLGATERPAITQSNFSELGTGPRKCEAGQGTLIIERSNWGERSVLTTLSLVSQEVPKLGLVHTLTNLGVLNPQKRI